MIVQADFILGWKTRVLFSIRGIWLFKGSHMNHTHNQETMYASQEPPMWVVELNLHPHYQEKNERMTKEVIMMAFIGINHYITVTKSPANICVLV